MATPVSAIIFTDKKDSPFIINNYKLFYEGTIWFSKFNNCYIKIIEYIDKFNVRIKFLDDYGFETIANLDNIKNGNVKNPYRINKYGGYFGIGKYTAINNMKIYKTWEGILKRTSPIYNDRNSYINTSLYIDWYNFQNFASWYCEYIKDLNKSFDYQIDKDILQWNFKYKIYSPDTCCLIPSRLNVALVGLNLSRINHPELPVGVMPNSNKYSSYITIEDKRVYLGNFETPEEAFEVYKQKKLSCLKELAEYYYSNNAIKQDIYEKICLINIE